MRKVIFEYWILAVKTQTEPNKPSVSIPGTGCFSEPQSGYFHQWGYELHEDANSIAMDSVAIVEHCTTGNVHLVQPGKMRFILPPENEALKPDYINWLKNAKKNKKFESLVYGTMPQPQAGCTKPKCNCLEIEEAKQGGLVKSYPCLADVADINNEKSKP